MTIRSLNQVADFTGDDGAHIRELAGRSTGLTSHSLAYITHPSGTASRAHHHTVSDEIYLVEAGTGRMDIDSESRTIGRGDVITIRPGQVHKVHSNGTGDLVLIVTCAPAYEVSEVRWDE